MADFSLKKEIQDSLNVSGSGVFGVARVIGTNDPINIGKVRIYPLSDTKDWIYLENNSGVEQYPWAEPLSITKGEGHGMYIHPEFGDFVLYTFLPSGYYILGSISAPSWEYSAVTTPVESQNIQKNGVEYNNTAWPNLSEKKYHVDDPQTGDIYQPASFLMRWRKNDILMYNATKINEQPNSAIKLMELRSSENSMLQFVDLGNFNIKPGLVGKNAKGYSPTRQTDYRDLFGGFSINGVYWTERTGKPPLTNESQYIKLALAGSAYKDAPHPDTGQDLPDLTRGENRLDDRMNDGSEETSKLYCPTYQTLKSAMGTDRYLQDKPVGEPWSASTPYRFKVKKWIEDTGDPYSPINSHTNGGHYLTMSNTIYKKRIVLGTQKGAQLVLSDVDHDEKIILSTAKGKFLYMEDGQPNTYNVTWMGSQSHHMIFCDHMQAPYLVDDKGKERHKLVDPNQPGCSAYQLIQTGKQQKIWLADTELCPRIHVQSTSGHELLLLDHDKGVSGCSPTSGKGKVQLTTADKKMQIVLDQESGKIIIQNHNPGGLDIYSKGDLSLKTEGSMIMEANAGFKVNSSGGMWIETTNKNITNSSGPGGPVAPTAIKGTVLSKIETTEGSLVNKFNPS